MEPVLKFGHDAEVASSPPHTPEEVLIFIGTGGHEPPLGGDHGGGKEVVAGDAELSHQPADASAQGQSGNSCS